MLSTTTIPATRYPMWLRSWAVAVVANLLLFAASPAPAWGQSCGTMQDLGTLGGPSSIAHGVSADGSVVVGQAYTAGSNWRGFLWTAAGGMRNIGTLGGEEYAYAVSADGSVIVGQAYTTANRYRAFRWTAPGGIQELGTLGGTDSDARGVSGDGSVVVGSARTSTNQEHAFRWTAAGGMQDLGTLGGLNSKALAASADGSVVVGWANNAAGFRLAFRWTAAGGMQHIGSLAGVIATAYGVSADGSVVVGEANDAAARGRAFRWTAAGGMHDLGTLGGTGANARGVSADGSVVVGLSLIAAGQSVAFRWTAAGGMQDIGTLGGPITQPFGVSADGFVIVGRGDLSEIQYHAFRSVGDTDGDGLLDDWECNGIPYIDAAGVRRRYILDSDGNGMSDADWRQKDLFIEVDSLPGRMISPAARQMVVAAFANAPNTNPDGTTGIRLHLQISDTSLASTVPWTTDANGWAIEFDQLKTDHFGTGTVQERAAKAKAYRYAICGDTIDDHSLGTAELPGNDLFITLGELRVPWTVELEAGTFMHELGHTLGLKHGGGDHVVGKPNYLSVMNYALTGPLPFSAAFWRLDYSREALPAMNESSLSEPMGISSSLYSAFEMPYGIDDGFGGRAIRFARLNGTATDWNGDGTATDMMAMQDLNFLDSAAPFAGVRTASFPQQMPGFDDWANIQLAIGTTGDFADFVHLTVPRDEITGEFSAWMHQNLVGTCIGDFNDDTIVNSQDFFDFLAAFFGQLPGADINADGTINSQDFFDFLAAFFAGC